MMKAAINTGTKRTADVAELDVDLYSAMLRHDCSGEGGTYPFAAAVAQSDIAQNGRSESSAASTPRLGGAQVVSPSPRPRVSSMPIEEPKSLRAQLGRESTALAEQFEFKAAAQSVSI